MLVLVRILHLALMAPDRLAAHAADVQATPRGFTWLVRRRSPAFQRVVSLMVELSTEAVGLLWLVAALGEGAGGPWVDALLPGWLLVQAVVVALVVTWEGRATPVRVVQLRTEELALGRSVVPLEDVAAVEVTSSGVGPWRTATLTVVLHRGEPVRVPADGDDDQSLHELAARIERARARAVRRAG